MISPVSWNGALEELSALIREGWFECRGFRRGDFQVTWLRRDDCGGAWVLEAAAVNGCRGGVFGSIQEGDYCFEGRD